VPVKAGVVAVVWEGARWVISALCVAVPSPLS
jgi:hypothetical protein